jgi:hypothetical protein
MHRFCNVGYDGLPVPDDPSEKNMREEPGHVRADKGGMIFQPESGV